MSTPGQGERPSGKDGADVKSSTADVRSSADNRDVKPSDVIRRALRLPRRALLMPIRWYQRFVSPLFPARCKYYPTCSAYAATAISRFGVIRGLPLALLRLLRCQPWVVGGIDDVPQRYSLFYRFRWSKAHEEPRLTPLSQTSQS